MATTTATISISSSDLLSSPLSLSASTECMQAGTTTGLEMVESGRGKITVADGTKTLKLAQQGGSAVTTAPENSSTKVYICNKATDPTYYIDVDIHDQRLGRLYAGDWLFMPWSQTDEVAALVIEAEGGTCEYEYAIFKDGDVLVAGA